MESRMLHPIPCKISFRSAGLQLVGPDWFSNEIANGILDLKSDSIAFHANQGLGPTHRRMSCLQGVCWVETQDLTGTTGILTPGTQL